jgi:hypothetical protein
MRRTLRIVVLTTVIMVLLFLCSAAWAQSKTVQSKTATVTTSKILVTKNPKVVKLKGQVSSKYVVPPKPLSRTMKAAYAREILRGLGVKKVELPPQVTKVKLTPVAPQSGLNWYEVHEGYNLPFPSNKRAAYTYMGYGRAVRGIYQGGSKLLLHFERTVPGKCYLLDIAATSPKSEKLVCKFGGAIEGNVNLEDGHIVAGFRANRTFSVISVQIMSPKYSLTRELLVYSIELTQVN